MTLCDFGLTLPSLKQWVYVLQSDDFYESGGWPMVSGRDVLEKATVRILGPGNEGQWVSLAAANNVKNKSELVFEKQQGNCVPMLLPEGKSGTQAPETLYPGRALFVPDGWKGLDTSVLKWTGEGLPGGDTFSPIRIRPDSRMEFDEGTPPAQSQKSSVWPYVALGAVGLLAVVLVAKAK